MPRAMRRLAALLIAVGLVGGSASTVLAVPRLDAAAPSSPASAPVDQSGITFKAFRSFDLAIVPGQPFYLSVMKWVPSGPMHFAELVDGEQVSLGTPTWSLGPTVNGNQAAIADFLLDGGATNGTHTYLAVFAATPEWDALTVTLNVDVVPAATTVTIETIANPVQTNQRVELYAVMSGPGTGLSFSGNIEWRDVDSDTVLGTSTPGDPMLAFDSLPVGVRHITASYSGDDAYAPSTSDVFTLTVIGDAVDASNVGVEYTTFYPVDDDYRDTVAIRGTRDESISVSIKITSPTGSSVKSKAIAAATGDYSYRWNGRNSAGTILASGKYKVVQTLTDSHGTKKSFTNYITLSKKKLVTHSKYVEKAGSSVTAKGSGSGGTVSTSSTGGYAKLTANSGWAIAGWEFYIPSATIYKSVSFQVYAKSSLTAPASQIAIQDFTTCPRVSGTWYDTCFGRWKTIGNSTRATAWFSTSGTSSSTVRSGRYVRGLVDVEVGTVYVYKARAKVTYAVLE